MEKWVYAPHTPDATNGRGTSVPYDAGLSDEICGWVALRFSFPGYDTGRRMSSEPGGHRVQCPTTDMQDVRVDCHHLIERNRITTPWCTSRGVAVYPDPGGQGNNALVDLWQAYVDHRARNRCRCRETTC